MNEALHIPLGFCNLAGESRRKTVGLTADAKEYGFGYLPYVNRQRYQVGTSTSRTFRRCPRKWAFQSSYRLGLSPASTSESAQNINFWFGSAIHFAMEDYFGWNRFGNPKRAFKAYYDCFDATERPNEAESHYELGLGMLDYFLQWYPKHNIPNSLDYLETAWFYHNEETNEWTIAKPFAEGAIPGVEIELTLNMGVYVAADCETGKIIGKMHAPQTHNHPGTHEDEPYMEPFSMDIGHYVLVGDTWEEHIAEGNRHSYSVRGESPRSFSIIPITFHGTVDKICVDSFGRLFLLDYKTAKSADVDKLDTDDQISRYCWAAQQYLGMPIEGFIYLQMTKATPKKPRVLTNGHISTDKAQKTTHALYKQALIDRYGSVEKSPSAAIGCLNALAEKEFPEGDGFVRWDRAYRTPAQQAAIYYTMLGEIEDMINPNRECYPSPTRDCIWDCNFRSACLALDKADYQEFKLALADFEPREAERGDEVPKWMKKLKYPQERPPFEVTDGELAWDQVEFNIILPEKKKEE